MAQLLTPGDWRELARQARDEKDPKKMVELVQQLVAKFDEEEHQRRQSRPEPTSNRIAPFSK
jgi:hypothetical protein